jgi:hypothetical protein
MSIDALDRPRPPKRECPPHKIAKRNSVKTVREFLTSDETDHKLVTLLKRLAAIRPKGPWIEYLQFYKANMSGDIPTMKPEMKKLVDKMKRDLEKEYAKNQSEEAEPADAT